MRQVRWYVPSERKLSVRADVLPSKRLTDGEVVQAPTSKETSGAVGS